MTSQLERLSTVRRDLQQFCRLREPSIWEFFDADRGWFRLTLNDVSERRSAPLHESKEPVADQQQGDASRPKKVKHLTTTLTCLEALAEGPLSDDDVAALEQAVGADDSSALPQPDQVGHLRGVLRRRAVLRGYVNQALQSPEDWLSDGAAFVYCRARTLGALSRLVDSNDAVLIENLEPARRLLAQAWRSHEDAPTFGLRESTLNPEAPDQPTASRGDTRDTYVPNAFLTYWGLLALRNLPAAARPDDWEACDRAAREWLEKSLAQQVAFHYGRSPKADPQQLAWSLCAHVNFASTDDITAKTTVAYAEVVAALKAFFDQQLADGDWDRGQPLFFYPTAGNAYCYVYETLAELLGLATVDGPRYRILRDALLPYFDDLDRVFRLAIHTQQRLGAEDKIGWSSGHNARRIAPEAWATASVYRFAEAFRRLVGVWANDEARRLLGARQATRGRQDLRERGGTWNAGRGGAGAQLSTGFLNPIKQHEDMRRRHTTHIPDPDAHVVPKHGARSAILFGPPGTGKTSLVEAVAGALEWPFVEITPAQFLDQGVELVSARADEIFRQVMELDRCVVLLDEIDELIQARTPEAQPVERFFTTTMLPRLAKLWNAGRLLFFVNTNNILRVDAAIRRSQRFDSAIFVLPPSHRKKAEMLREQHNLILLSPSEDEVSAHLRGQSPEDMTKPEDKRLAWFALLRHDQMERFGRRLRQANGASSEADRSHVADALPPFIEELQGLDWHDFEEHVESCEDDPPRDFDKLLRAQRRDPNVRLLATVDDSIPPSALPVEQAGGYVTIPDGEEDPESWAASAGLTLSPDGVLMLNEQ